MKDKAREAAPFRFGENAAENGTHIQIPQDQLSLFNLEEILDLLYRQGVDGPVKSLRELLNLCLI